jgi:hypothetical protein
MLMLEREDVESLKRLSDGPVWGVAPIVLVAPRLT